MRWFTAWWKPQGEQAEDLRIPEAPADRDPKAHGRYQSRLPGRPPPLVGEPAGGVSQTNLNITNGAPAKNRSPVNFGSRYEWLGFYKAREQMKELLTANSNFDRLLGMDEEREEPNATKEKGTEQR